MVDENINELLGVENSPISNNSTKNVEEANKQPSYTAETTLTVIANIVLVVGIIVGLICLFTICWVDSGKYSYSRDTVFNPSGFMGTIGVFVSSIVTWAVLKVFANISTNLKQINAKMK